MNLLKNVDRLNLLIKYFDKLKIYSIFLNKFSLSKYLKKCSQGCCVVVCCLLYVLWHGHGVVKVSGRGHDLPYGRSTLVGWPILAWPAHSTAHNSTAQHSKERRRGVCVVWCVSVWCVCEMIYVGRRNPAQHLASKIWPQKKTQA